MAAYVLDEPTPSAVGGAACWAGTGGLATTVVMVAEGRRWTGGSGEGQIDCRSEEWQGLVGSPLHQVSRDCAQPGRLEAGATRAAGADY
jgi:hypothetical protein